MQPTRQDVVNIGTACDDIICDAWNYHELLLKKWIVKRSHVEKSCKKAFYVFLLKFDHVTQDLKISVVLLPWKQ